MFTAEMYEVVAAILRDIAQARYTSDIYSSLISRDYERDEILRLFPVPRSEIKEFEIDLNFSIFDINRAAYAESSKVFADRNVYYAFQRYSEKFINIIAERIKDYFENTGISDHQNIIDFYIFITADEEFRITVHNGICDLLNTNFSNLVKQENGDRITETAKIISDFVKEIYFSDKYRKRYYLVEPTNGYQDESSDDITYENPGFLESKNITYLIGSIPGKLFFEISYMWTNIDGILTAAHDFKVDIDVASDILRQLPEYAISSIKIRTEIQNYNWEHIGDGKVERMKLVPG